MAVRFKAGLISLALAALGLVAHCTAQTLQPPTGPALGSVSGTVVDSTGAVVAGARVKLTGASESLNQEAVSGGNGQFSFANVVPGPFQLTFTSPGFATQTSSGTLGPGESYIVPKIALAVASNITDVQVDLSRIEIAEEQIKDEEQQRILGIVPNFYVTYDPHAVALTPKQKYKLALRAMVDPFTFGFVAGTAGVQQAQNHFVGYGQGAQGYAKRFGANYADNVSAAFIGGAILPSLLKQDPRYFYKGTGTVPARVVYALSMSVFCKGDNGRRQVNYSGILGSLASGGISNLYYPSADRSGADITFENAALGLAENAITNVLQEFVIRKLTPNTSRSTPAQP